MFRIPKFNEADPGDILRRYHIILSPNLDEPAQEAWGVPLKAALFTESWLTVDF